MNTIRHCVDDLCLLEGARFVNLILVTWHRIRYALYLILIHLMHGACWTQWLVECLQCHIWAINWILKYFQLHPGRQMDKVFRIGHLPAFVFVNACLFQCHQSQYVKLIFNVISLVWKPVIELANSGLDIDNDIHPSGLYLIIILFRYCFNSS